MKHYLIFLKRTNSLSAEALKEMLNLEQQRFNDLLRENVAEQFTVSKDFDKIWLHVKAENKHQVIEIISTLPVCNQMLYEIDEIFW